MLSEIKTSKTRPNYLYSAAQIEEMIASNKYSAEFLLNHLIFNYNDLVDENNKLKAEFIVGSEKIRAELEDLRKEVGSYNTEDVDILIRIAGLLNRYVKKNEKELAFGEFVTILGGYNIDFLEGICKKLDKAILKTKKLKASSQN